GLGILAGIWLESYRESKIKSLYDSSEISLIDMKSTENFIELVECDKATNELITFANKIYEEAQILERYEGASRLTENLIVAHKRYDLLRASLFLSAIKTKIRCNSTYNVITYFYDYIETPMKKKSKQNVFSKYLFELKKSKPEGEIILIPIAGDNNLRSVEIIMEKYNITQLPTILVNENVIITELEDLDNIKIILNKSGN
ncbi:MAG: hypothetical protein QW622_02185, partial [Candidatus Pacearchaeota archaeon]